MKQVFKTACAVFFFAIPFLCLAQPGLAEFGQAEQEIKSWYFSFSDLVLIIGAIAGLAGGLRVYTNWQSGKHHIDAQVMGWFFSCLFLSLVGTFLRALYRI